MLVSINPNQVSVAINYALIHYADIYSEYSYAKKCLFQLINSLLRDDEDCYMTASGAFLVMKDDCLFDGIQSVSIYINPKVEDYDHFVVDTNY